MEIIIRKSQALQTFSGICFFMLLLTMLFGIEMKGMFTGIGLSNEAKAMREAAHKKYLGSREQRIIKLQLQKTEFQLKNNEFFVYEKGTSKGVKVDKDVLMLSNISKSMFGNLDNPTTKLLLLPNPQWGSFTLKTIEATFDILDHIHKRKLLKKSIKKTESNINEDLILQAQIQSQSTEELINITELINYLQCNSVIKHIYFSAVKNRVDSGQEKVIHALSTIKNPTLWKQLLLSPTIIGYIKGLMIHYNIKHIKEDSLGWGSFSNQMISILVFSPDNKSIAVGRDIGPNACSLFDIETKTMKAGINLQRTYPASRITSIAFNKNGKNILTATSFLGLFLWTLENVIFKQKNYLAEDEEITKAIFNPINNDEVLICKQHYQGNNLQLLDVTEKSFQSYQNFIDKEIIDIAFSPDGTKIAAASYANNIFLWNQQKSLRLGWECDSEVPTEAIKSIAFTSQGTKIIASYIANKPDFFGYCDTNLCIIDISNPKEPNDKHFSVLKNTKKQALSFLLTQNDELIAWDSLGSMFLITFDDNGITNEIPLRQAPCTGYINALALSSNEEMLAGGGKEIFAKENYVHLWTTLTDHNKIILNNLRTLADAPFTSNQDTYKLIYQFWLNSRKGIAPSHYKMDAKEQDIYKEMPRLLKMLFE